MFFPAVLENIPTPRRADEPDADRRRRARDVTSRRAEEVREANAGERDEGVVLRVMGARTELGRALETLAATQTREKRLGANAKASILYDARDAADVDRETIHAIAVRGFEELCRRDGRFEGFVKTLFSRARAEAGHRESEDAETSRATSVEIRRYLRLLSGYFTEKCAISTLEYLVRRFKIHVYDVDDFIACALPWHSTAEFVKCAQTCQLENSKHFKWLSGVKETGAAPPRDALAVRCSKDKAFFSFCAERATEMATAKVRGSSVSRFRLIRFCFDLFFHGEWDVRSRPRALVRIATRDGSPLAVVHVFF